MQIFHSTKCLADFLVIFSACKYFKERIWLFAVGINIDVGTARFNFQLSIFNLQYINLHIAFMHDDCAIFLGEEGEGEAIYCDMAIGRVCGGIGDEGVVDGLARIGGGIYEVVTMEADGVFGDLHHRAFPCDVGSEWG